MAPFLDGVVAVSEFPDPFEGLHTQAMEYLREEEDAAARRRQVERVADAGHREYWLHFHPSVLPDPETFA